MIWPFFVLYVVVVVFSLFGLLKKHTSSIVGATGSDLKERRGSSGEGGELRCEATDPQSLQDDPRTDGSSG